jgi:hypothetical protein
MAERPYGMERPAAAPLRQPFADAAGTCSNQGVSSDSNVSADIEHRLATAAQEVREREVLSQRCANLSARHDELNAELASLHERYSAEQADIERLEGISLSRVVASLAGSRDERLARERAEAQAARYRVAEMRAQLDALRDEHDAARQRLDRLATASDRYSAALDAKERYVSQSGDPRSSELLMLAQERGRLSGELKETEEALEAAGAALNALSLVQDRLGSAAGWSTYDTWFGGGAIASSVKHSRLDEAAQAAAEADRCLAVLRTELADVGDPGLTGPQLQIGGGTRFADVWFDNIFTDLAVADRIRQAQQNVARSLDAVQQLRSRLHARQENVRNRLGGIEAQRQRILTA